MPPGLRRKEQDQNQENNENSCDGRPVFSSKFNEPCHEQHSQSGIPTNRTESKHRRQNFLQKKSAAPYPQERFFPPFSRSAGSSGPYYQT
jgi:hypothetical protein